MKGLPAIPWLVLCACALGQAPTSPYDVGFRGPGRLALVWEVEGAEGGLERTVVVYAGREPRTLPLPGVSHVRWLGEGELLVARELPPEPPDYAPRSELIAVEVGSALTRTLAPPGRYLDAEPSPDRRWLALGIETDELGGGELQVWTLAGEPAPVARRALPFDRPVWSPDGAELLTSRMLSDPDDSVSGEGVAVHGVGLSFPRLFRLRRDLSGPPARVRDGRGDAEAAPGGSFPLWWDRAGLWVRQREGLARCDAGGSGCELVYAPGPARRVMRGRPVGESAALLIVVDESGGHRAARASELHRVDLATGRGRVLYRALEGVALVGLDWSPGGSPGRPD